MGAGQLCTRSLFEKQYVVGFKTRLGVHVIGWSLGRRAGKGKFKIWIRSRVGQGLIVWGGF